MDWIALSAVSGAVVAGGTVSVFVFRHLHPKVVAIRQFWGSLVGVEVNVVTGQERRPGLFERLDGLESRLEARLDSQDETLAKQDRTLAAQNTVLETIRHELFPNSGKSMRDDQNKLRDQVDSLAQEMREHLAKCPTKDQ